MQDIRNLSKTHPIIVINSIKKRYKDISFFEFGKYKYERQSLGDDDRDIVKIHAPDISIELIHEIIEKLPEGFELALQSRVYDKSGDTLHIPMIDFGKRIDSRSIDRMRSILAKRFLDELLFFDSGNAYHGYVPMLIDHDEWLEFMGLLLLMNYPKEEPLVDARWIGHSLRVRYFALRFSCKTKNYLKIPTLVNIKYKKKGA